MHVRISVSISSVACVCVCMYEPICISGGGRQKALVSMGIYIRVGVCIKADKVIDECTGDEER